MEYNAILRKIEEQKKDENLSAKLFRYNGLMQAIEFFSQKLNFDQIIDAAFDFVNELLTLERSAVFVLQGNSYVLKKLKGHDSDITIVKNNDNMHNLAVFHGTLLYEREQLEKFFDKTFLDSFGVTTVLPLIIDTSLYGFILIYNKMQGEFGSDDHIIAEALMKLFNNALENYKRYEELQKANKDLDEKIFNLFAINQSSKALLSELSLDVLYNLSVDVFSELTQSAVTGFVLYDERVEKYVLKAFKDIFYREADVEVGLTLNKLARLDLNKIIIDVSDENDIAYFNNVFKEGIGALKPLNPAFIVLLVKNGKILGFVTLAATVTGFEYKKSMFELIESLASATYLALSNANLFKQVIDQKKIIQGKLEKLISLNNLMKNINSSLKVETLIDLTLKTMDISFDVDKALIALYDREKDVFNIAQTLNVDTKVKTIKPNDSWKRIFEGDSIYEVKEDAVLQYISGSLRKDIGAAPGVLIAPIYIERIEVELIGIIVIFRYKKLPINDEEHLLTFETIAGHVAPVLSNLYTLEEQKRFSLPNYIEMFKRDLKDDINDAVQYELELQICQITDERDIIFKESSVVNKIRNNFKKAYPFSNNHVFIIVNDKEAEAVKKIQKTAGIKEISIRTYSYGKDFKSFQEFFKLFNV